MSAEPIDSTPHSARWLWILPFAAALLFHAGPLRAPLALDDTSLVARLKEIPGLSPSSVFFENYVRQNRVDRGYRPLAFATYLPVGALVEEADSALPHRLINLLLHATVSIGVFLLLKELGGQVLIAALGATIFAVLPIHTDAVARVAGRAEILGALFAVAAWILALRSTRPGTFRGHESPLLAAAVGGLTLAALLSKENDALLLPLVLALSAWALGRSLPWGSLASSAGAILGYFAFRCVVLEDRAGFSSLLLNPLRDDSLVSWAPHMLRHLFLLVRKSVIPLGLSAEYSYLDTPRAGVALLAPATLGFLLLAGTAALCALGKQRGPLTGLGLASFFLLAIPAALVLTPQKHVFAERNAYLPGVGLALALSGIALHFVGRRRGVVLGALIAVIALCAGRTVLRNEDWASAEAGRLIPARLESDWPRELFQVYSKLSDLARGPLEQRELRSYMQSGADWILERSPENGWALAAQAQALFEQGKNAEVLVAAEKAIAWLESQRPPIVEPRVYRLRGEALLIAGRDKEALRDLDRHVRLMESSGQKPDAQAYSRLGLCLAKSGQLELALERFNAALALRQDQAELWNNRGFAKFKLKDYQGAVDDYKAGYEVCRRSNTVTSPDGDSMHAFLLRLSDVYRIWGEELAGAGEVGAAKTASEQARGYRSEASKLVSASGASPGR